jgi:hypothetical protein
MQSFSGANNNDCEPRHLITTGAMETEENRRCGYFPVEGKGLNLA